MPEARQSEGGLSAAVEEAVHAENEADKHAVKAERTQIKSRRGYQFTVRGEYPYHVLREEKQHYERRYAEAKRYRNA